MSTSQGLGIIGAAIGAYYGGPKGAQWGYAIGSTVGSIIDPEVIKGPDLGDAKQQTSQAGIPIVKVYGMPAPFAGTLIDGDKVSRKYTKREQQGKGGPVVESQGFKATRAILVCEGEVDFARIRRNNKLVYSTIAGDTLDADSATFASQARLYRGTDTQLPDPSLEAIHGVGNTPYYRGRAYMVVVDDDETQTGGAANQYLFQMASNASVGPVPGTYESKDFAGHTTPWNPGAPSLRDPRRSDVTYEYAGFGYNTDYTDPSVVWRATVEEAIADQAALLGYAAIGTPELMGWSTRFGGIGNDTAIAPWGSVSDMPFDWTDRYVLGLCYSRYAAELQTAQEITNGAQCNIYAEQVWTAKIGTGVTWRNVTIQQASVAPAGNDNTTDCYDGASNNATGLKIYSGYTIACRPIRSCGDPVPLDSIEAPDAPGYYARTHDGELIGLDTCMPVTGTFRQLSLLADGLDGGGLGTAVILAPPLGPILISGDSNYSSQTYWDAQYATAVAAGDLPSGWTYSITGNDGVGTYPRNTTSACQCVPPGDVLTEGGAVWKDIALDIASRTPCPISKLDVDNMTDAVPGFILARADLSGNDYLRALCGPYFVTLPEYDGQLHAIRFGGASVATITTDDLLEIEDDDDNTRKQVIEAPARVTLAYPDPANNYVVTPQTARRSVPDIQSTGEKTVQTIIPFTAAQSAQIADKMQKVDWTRVQGGFTRALTAKHSRLVPSDAIEWQNERYIIDRARYEDSMITIECTHDRISDYQSSVSGANAPTPTGQTSNTKGPTILAVLNLPSLKSSDNEPGMYVAIQGLLPGYPGCDLYLSVDGGVTEQFVLSIIDQAVIGELAEACDADGADSTGLISVQVYVGGELASITDAQVAARQNGFALVSSGVAEIGQFKDATETSTERLYDLTNVTRGELETTAAAHAAGDRFVLLDGAVKFLPIDPAYAGQTLIFRAVTKGTLPANNDPVSVVFDPPTFVINGGGDA